MIKKVSNKFIKDFRCEDISGASFDDIQTLHKTIDYDVVYVSCGCSGVNGCIIQDYNTGKYYKVCARSSALFMLI